MLLYTMCHNFVVTFQTTVFLSARKNVQFYLSPCGSCVYFTKRLTTEKDVTPDDSVSRVEHETTREQLEGEVNHLTQLLQGALRKQDEMALEAADAWQKVRGKRSLWGGGG